MTLIIQQQVEAQELVKQELLRNMASVSTKLKEYLITKGRIQPMTPKSNVVPPTFISMRSDNLIKAPPLLYPVQNLMRGGFVQIESETIVLLMIYGILIYAGYWVYQYFDEIVDEYMETYNLTRAQAIRRLMRHILGWIWKKLLLAFPYLVAVGVLMAIFPFLKEFIMAFLDEYNRILNPPPPQLTERELKFFYKLMNISNKSQ